LDSIVRALPISGFSASPDPLSKKALDAMNRGFHSGDRWWKISPTAEVYL
jgi:hypothetical protein